MSVLVASHTSYRMGYVNNWYTVSAQVGRQVGRQVGDRRSQKKGVLVCELLTHGAGKTGRKEGRKAGGGRRECGVISK